MKRIFAVCALAAVMSHGLYAALETVDLDGSDAQAPAGRVVACSAVSTNSTGTLVVSRVTPLVYSWTEEREVATTSRIERVEICSSNIVTEVVTNIPTANPAVTNTVTNIVVTVDSWPVTNRSWQVSREIVRTPRTALKPVTNQLFSLTLSGGAVSTNFANGALVLPRDYIATSGTALPGGRAYIVIER